MPAEAKRRLLMELRRERELIGDRCAVQESRRCVHVTLAITVTLAGVPLALLRDDWRAAAEGTAEEGGRARGGGSEHEGWGVGWGG